MSKTLYHNFTKTLCNMDGEDFCDTYSRDDIIMKSRYGDATLYCVSYEEITELFNKYENEDAEKE